MRPGSWAVSFVLFSHPSSRMWVGLYRLSLNNRAKAMGKGSENVISGLAGVGRVAKHGRVFPEGCCGSIAPSCMQFYNQCP